MTDLEEKLLVMCTDNNFCKEIAIELIKNVNLNQELPDIDYPESRTSFLTVAVQNKNIDMLRILLESGANPNFVLYEDKPNYRENPFWDLQYNGWGETAEEDEIGLEMAQLMLDYGANPNIFVEDEDLFSWVCCAVFNDDYDDLWEYRSRFFILLIAYGGKNDYCKPKIYKEFDKANMSQYKFNLVLCADKYHFTGEIVDEKYDVVAEI